MKPKKFNRILSILLTVMLMLSLLPINSLAMEAEYYGGDIYIEDSTITYAETDPVSKQVRTFAIAANMATATDLDDLDDTYDEEDEPEAGFMPEVQAFGIMPMAAVGGGIAIYDMQNELVAKNDGDIITGTSVLIKSGTPTITVRNYTTTDKGLVLTNRTTADYAIDIKLSELTISSGNNYEVAVTGKISSGSDNYVKLSTTGDGTVLAEDNDSNAAFELRKIFSYSELQSLPWV